MIEFARSRLRSRQREFDRVRCRYAASGCRPHHRVLTGTGKVEHRDEDSDLGGTMRLGRQECPVEADTLAHSIYGDHVAERHRHRYEVNNSYVSQFEEKGMVIAARTPKDHLPEIMEIHNHPFFIGVQFHPEFTSNPREGHPLFTAYVKAAIAERDRKATAEEKAE